jgi:L-ribulose-5-phosphate 4-epimerase
MYNKQKREIIETALEIKRSRLISLSGGNVSLRLPNGQILVTPSGTSYETMKIKDIIVFDSKGKRIEGKLRESVDTVALLYIFEHMPDVNAIIHTHQPYATAAGLIGDTLPAAVTTLANVTLGAVNVAPYCSAASLDMGVQTVKYIGERRAVILKHHGVITVGRDLKEALYAAVYMEDAALTYLAAKAAGDPVIMTQEQTLDAVEIHKTYGQKNH